MFATLLNKGLRGSIVLLILFFIFSYLLLYFSVVNLESVNPNDLFYKKLSSRLTSRSIIIVINLLFVCLSLFILNLIITIQEVVEKTNFFVIFIYLILCVASINPLQVNSDLIANTFILFSLYQLFDTYRKENVLKQIFESAFWLFFSCFIAVSKIIILPIFIIALLILRPFKWQELTISILGFTVPFFIFECVAYLINSNRWFIFKNCFLYFHSFKLPTFKNFYAPFLIVLFLLFLISVIKNIAGGFGNTLKKQKTKSILFWLLFFTFFTFFSVQTTCLSIILSLSIPFSFLIGDYLFEIKKIKITNIFLTLLLISILLIFVSKIGLYNY